MLKMLGISWDYKNHADSDISLATNAGNIGLLWK